MAKNKNTPLAFLSHSSKDKERVRELANLLRTRNINIWLDEEQILPGDSITRKIEDGIERSDVILVFISRQFLASSWCRKEYDSAIVREIELQRTVIIPLLMDDSKPLTLLRDKAWLDLSTGLEDEGLNRLVDAIRAARSATRVFRMRRGPLTIVKSEKEENGVVTTELSSYGSNLAMIIRSVVNDFPVRNLSDQTLLKGSNLIDLYTTVDTFIMHFQDMCDEILDVVRAGSPVGYGSAYRAGKDRVANTNRKLFRIASDMRDIASSIAHILDSSSELRHRIAEISMICASISYIEDWLVLRVGAPDELEVEKDRYGLTLPGSLPNWVAPEQIANLPIYNETSGTRYYHGGHEPNTSEFKSLIKLLDKYRKELRRAIANERKKA